MNARGPVFKYGDNIDTDVIIPARYLNTQSAAELASHCMEDIDKSFVARVKAGDIMVGGENFGCGSSREHAPVAIKAAGIDCVIAKSFARIFYRNAINIGLKVLTCPQAKEIAHGKMHGCRLTILYGSVKSDDIVLKDELDQICAECPDVKVVHVLSDDPDWPGEHGFITREIIEKYAAPNSTFLFCGPLAMFRFVRKALEDMGVPQRRFRHDVVNNPADISTLPGYPKGTEEKTFRITVVRGIHEDVIDARASESVAVALERSAIPVDTHCRNGECGFCRSQLLGGDIFVSPIGDGRRAMDKELGWFHACSAYPLSDLKIKIPIM